MDNTNNNGLIGHALPCITPVHCRDTKYIIQKLFLQFVTLCRRHAANQIIHSFIRFI